MPPTLNELLKTMVEQGASDLHLTTNSPPQIRHDGRLKPLNYPPLTPSEKSDVIRAVVGYALAEDALGLARFREKYAPLMNVGADKVAFDTASKPTSTNSSEFAAIAKMAASVDTLDGFLREMKTRFPDATARAPLPPENARGEPVHTGSLPEIVGLKRVEAKR